MVANALRFQALTCFLLVASANLANAQNVIDAKGRGAEAQFALAAGADKNTPIYFYYVSKGRDTKTVQMMLRAPQGAVGTIAVAKLVGNPSQAAANLSNSYNMQLRDTNGARNALRITQVGAASASRSFAVA